MSLDEEVLIERTLFHLSLCAQNGDELERSDADEKAGPACSTWADLLAAIMEGFQRGWVEEAHLTREDGITHLRWRATDRGDRAIDAHRRRIQKAPIVDETGETQ